MCAVGCLIPDDQYRPEMDRVVYDPTYHQTLGTNISIIRRRFPDVPFFAQMTDRDEAFLSELQSIHDDDYHAWANTETMKETITIVFGNHFNLEFMDELRFADR